MAILILHFCKGVVNLVPIVYFIFNHVYNSKPWDGNSLLGPWLDNDFTIRICSIFIGTASRRQPTMYKQAMKSGTVLRDYDEDVNFKK